jgi:hypothetical protein
VDITEIEWGDVDCIDLAQDRNQWQTYLNKVMDLKVTKYAGSFLTGEKM